MKICFICTEIFEWGKYGGFGRATRIIGRELVKRGIEVYAVIPRRNGQKEFELLDGIKVLGFPKTNPFYASRLFKMCDADIYHSQEPSFITYLAVKEMQDKVHLVTSRDPKWTGLVNLLTRLTINSRFFPIIYLKIITLLKLLSGKQIKYSAPQNFLSIKLRKNIL